MFRQAAPPNSSRRDGFVALARQQPDEQQDVGGGQELVLAPSEEVSTLQTKIYNLKLKEEELNVYIDDMGKALERKRVPVQEELSSLEEEIRKLSALLAVKMDTLSPYPPAPGPRELKFVDSAWFGTCCNTVVILNLACMVFANNLQRYHLILYVLDQLFLLWYVLELAAKWKYHRCNLFCGNPYIVWWNWLDAGIVLGGVVDQWLFPLVQYLIRFEIPPTWTCMRALRLFRLFRVMRFLKVIKAFMHFDHLTEQPCFKLFMSAVIIVNSVVLALELDVDWVGWAWFENVFLIIYSFELSLRIKLYGWHFFINRDFMWNNLDFVMVCGGAFDLWLVPFWSFIQVELYGETEEQDIKFTTTMHVLRMMKILRALRLVRLLRVVKFLHSLLVGISEAMSGMRSVIVLVLLVLYGGAIIFTSLFGHGYIFLGSDDVPPEAKQFFGSVPHSMFSLFKLMNGDTNVVDNVAATAGSELLIASFMVVSNWATLAIFTAVVSDKLISSSQRATEDEKEKEMSERLHSRARMLAKFFQEVDTDQNRSINRVEWDAMLLDPNLRDELIETTNLDAHTLHDVFACFSNVNEDLSEYMLFEDLVSYLNHDSEVANRRQVLHLTHLMKQLERMTLDRVGRLESALKTNQEAIQGSVERLEGRIERLEGMLERSMASAHKQESRAEDRHALEKSASSKIEKLEATTQQKFQNLEGTLKNMESMLSKVMRALSQKNVQEGVPVPDQRTGSPVPHEIESRVGKLEDSTQQKLEALENMMETVIQNMKPASMEYMMTKVMHAVTQTRRI